MTMSAAIIKFVKQISIVLWYICIIAATRSFFANGDSTLDSVDLLNSHFVSLSRRFYDEGSTNYHEAESTTVLLQNGTARLDCSKDNWNSTQPYAFMRLAISTDRKFSFRYGSIQMKVKPPVTGFVDGSIALAAPPCPNTTCLQSLGLSSTGFSFSSASPSNLFVNYIHPSYNGRTYSEEYPTSFGPADREGYHSIRVDWWPKYIVWRIDGVVAKNLTNRLALPQDENYIDLSLSCPKNTINLSKEEVSPFVISQLLYRKLPNQDSWYDESDDKAVPPAVWRNQWNGTNTTVDLFAYDDDVAVYFDKAPLSDSPGSNNRSVDNRIFVYTGNAWRYASRQFGPLTQHNGSRFYTIFQQMPDTKCYVTRQKDPQSGAHQNILTCGNTEAETWYYERERVPSPNGIVRAISYFAAWSSRNVHGNPTVNLDNGALQDIVEYDLHMKLQQPKQARIVVSDKTLSTSSYPREGSHWFSGWYLPIYRTYGGAQVLSRYLTLVADNFPTEARNDTGRQYKRNMTNLGEIVHFWSGAANTSLRNLSKSAFGWTVNDEADLRQAQKDFPKVAYLNDTSPIVFDTRTDNLTALVTTTESPSSSKTSVIAPAVAVPCILVALLAIWYRRRKNRASRYGKTKIMKRNLLEGYPSTQALHAMKSIDSTISQDTLKYNVPEYLNFKFGANVKPFLIPKTQLEQSQVVLGKGEFGIVYLATASGLYGVAGSVTVAAKVLNKRTQMDDDDSRRLFELEVNTMIQAGQHLNLVNLLGIVLGDYPILLIELCDGGSLLSLLRDCRSKRKKFINMIGEDGRLALPAAADSYLPVEPNDIPSGPAEETEGTNLYLPVAETSTEDAVTTIDLISLAYQISRGLEYLSAKNIVHRDIAARNILLDKHRVAKISDFGMARWCEKSYVLAENSTNVALPVRWMAPEVIISLSFDQSSDVWSFGVTLWEILSLGLVPYVGVLIAGNVAHFSEWLSTGNHLDKPEYCPDNVYELMKTCWTVDKTKRPTFSDLRPKLQEMLSSEVADYYMQLDQPYQQFNIDLDNACEDECEPVVDQEVGLVDETSSRSVPNDYVSTPV